LPNESNNRVYKQAFSIYENLYKKLMPDMEAAAALRD
jgi:hypothetical protein